MITAWDVNDIAGRMGAIQPDRILRKPIHTGTLVTLLNGAGRRPGFPAAPPAAVALAALATCTTAPTYA